MRICFVCTGNICRSPTGEGVLRHLLTEAGIAGDHHVASAGTTDYHAGEAPDRRTVAAANKRGVLLDSVAQAFRAEMLDQYDLVLAMDTDHLRYLQRLRGSRPVRAKLRMLRELDPHAQGEIDVPDPYYGAALGFDQVFDICWRSCTELVRLLRAGQL